MGIVKLDIFDRKGRLRPISDEWFIYAAFVQPQGGPAVIKIGITTHPYNRFFQIQCGSPFPVDAALWSPVGDKSAAHQVESAVKKQFAARKTRGEWFQFDLASEADKRDFHDTLKSCFEARTGKLLTWRKVSRAQIQDYANVRTAERGKRPKSP